MGTIHNQIKYDKFERTQLLDNHKEKILKELDMTIQKHMSF